MKKLLFHPHVTLAAMLTGIISVAAALATLATPLAGIIGKGHAAQVVDVCLLISGVAGAIAGTGRSPITAVDNAPQGK